LTDLRALATPFLAPVGLAGIVIIFTIFMLIKREDLRNRALRLVGLGQISVMTQALDDAAQRVSRYLLMQFRDQLIQLKSPLAHSPHLCVLKSKTINLWLPDA